MMNFLRPRVLRGWCLLYRNVNKPNPNPTNNPSNMQLQKQRSDIQTAPDRLSGQYIEQVRLMAKEQIKRPWYKFYGILLMLSILPTYYLTYKAISADENNFEQHQRVRMALNTYYLRAAFFTSIVAMIAALRFRNPTLVFVEQTNMNAIPLILPLLGCMVGLSLPPTWSSPLILVPAFITEGLLTLLIITRRSIPVPLLYFKTYCLYYDLFVLVILGICLWSYHKDQKKLLQYA